MHETTLAKVMRDKGLKVTGLANRLGKSKGYVSNLASGRYRPSDEVARKLEEITGIAWHEFIEPKAPSEGAAA